MPSLFSAECAATESASPFLFNRGFHDIEKTGSGRFHGKLPPSQGNGPLADFLLQGLIPKQVGNGRGKNGGVVCIHCNPAFMTADKLDSKRVRRCMAEDRATAGKILTEFQGE